MTDQNKPLSQHTLTNDVKYAKSRQKDQANIAFTVTNVYED
jgi:hypothetical protein